MAVRISMAPLAAAVAEAGGIGLIAGSGLSVDELRAEIRKAREKTSGVVGVNIMVAVRIFKDLVQAAMAEGADLIVAGAGFSRDVFSWGKAAGVPVVPIVGSVRVAKLAERFGASAVVVEGFEAGGHLGTDRLMLDLLPEIVEAVTSL
jgi:nitronate monooxygenase